MKVLIMSPGKNTGNTLATALIGGAFAMTQNTDVCLTYTTTARRRLCDYFGVSVSNDITTNIRQIHNLIDANAIAPEDCKDYMLRVREHLYVLDTTSTEILPEDRVNLMHSVFAYDVAPIMICDISHSNDVLDKPLVQSLISEADVIIMSIMPDRKSYEFLAEWTQSGKFPKDKQYSLLINNYDERIASVRDIAKLTNFKLRDTLKIHYNPYVRVAANKGEIVEVLQSILAKDPNVIELRQDLKEVCQALTYYNKSRLKWED